MAIRDASAALVGGGRLYEIPASNASAAIDFQQRWAAPGPWILSSKTLKGFPTRAFYPGQEQEAAAWVAEHDRRRENQYWQPNLPHGDFNKKPAVRDISAARGCHVDVDPRDGYPLGEERERILAVMLAHQPPLTVIIDSGGGFQGFYLLEEPSTDLAAVVTINKWLEKKLGGDHCHDICCVTRLPGSVNYGDAKKLAKGRAPALAHVVQADWGRRYAVEDLLLGIDPEPGPEPPPPELDIPDHPALRKLMEVPAKCRLLILTGKHPSGDRSRGVYSVVCELLRCGYRDDLIVSILLDPTLGISEHVREQGNPARYARSQITHAVRKIEFTSQKEHGAPIPNSQDNIRIALRKLGVHIAYDCFADRMLIAGLDGTETIHLAMRSSTACIC
jgi:hypothetical protein